MLLARSTYRVRRNGVKTEPRSGPVRATILFMWSGNRTLVAAVLSVAAVSPSCGPGSREVEQAIRDYCAAVQNRDLAQLTCLSSGAADVDPDQFHAWVESQYAAYLDGRDRGSVDVESGGIAMVKTFSIGHGTYYTVDQVRATGEGTVQAVLNLTFGYGAIDLSGLLPGTTFYVAGSPPGTVHGIVVPREREEIEREVLTSLRLIWTLVREEKTDGCDPAWTVHTVAVDPDSVRTTHLAWMF